MRLTLVTSSLDAGGTERVIAIMANHWARNGQDVTLFTFDDGRRPPFYSLDQKVNRLALGLTKHSPNVIVAVRNNVRRVRRLRAAIVESKPDCVISFQHQTNVLTLFATRGLGIPVLVNERNFAPLQPLGKSWSMLREFIYPRASRLVTLTERAMNAFSPSIRSRSMAIPNPVVAPVDGARSRSAGCSIIAVGRLSREKGHDLLLKAFAKVKDQHPGWNLTILGEGPARQELESQREQLGLSHRVSMPGLVANPEEYLKQSDLFVMPSRTEGFPMALCEAMAHGLPVISTDCPTGPREIITDGEDGILVPNEDVAALAAAMDRLINDEGERKRLSSNAVHITERFGVKKVMRMWDDLLREVVTTESGVQINHD